MQASGFYSKHGHFAAYNEGDPIKLVQLKTISQVIEKQDLIKKAASTISQLKLTHQKLQGQGNNLEITCENASKAKHELLTHGVLSRVIDAKTVGLYPSLVFEEKHSHILDGVLRKCSSL